MSYNFVQVGATDEARLQAIEARLTAVENDVADLKYTAIAINKFTASPSTAEVGSVVNSITFSWSLNKTPTELTFDGEAVDVDSTSKTVTGEFTESEGFTLKATDERDATATKGATLSFLHCVYYGAAAEPATYDSAFILSLTKTTPRSSKLSSVTVNAGEGQYIYYCLPVSMGACSFKSGGFEGGFTLVDTIQFTNVHGAVESYYIYKSDSANLGSTSVSVS